MHNCLFLFESKKNVRNWVDYTKINSKYIKDLCVRPDTLKLLKKSTGKTPPVIGKARDFQSRAPVA